MVLGKLDIYTENDEFEPLCHSARIRPRRAGDDSAGETIALVILKARKSRPGELGASWRKRDCYLEYKTCPDRALRTLDASWRSPGQRK